MHIFDDKPLAQMTDLARMTNKTPAKFLPKTLGTLKVVFATLNIVAADENGIRNFVSNNRMTVDPTTRKGMTKRPRQGFA